MDGLDLILPSAAHVDYVESHDQMPDLSVATTVADRVFLARIRRDTPLVVSKLYCYVGTANGTLDIGVYLYDGTTFNLLGHTGAVAQAGTSLNEFSPTAALVLPVSGQLYLAFGTDSATITVAQASQGTSAMMGVGNKFLLKSSVYSSGLPATITSPQAAQPMIWSGARA